MIQTKKAANATYHKPILPGRLIGITVMDAEDKL